MEYWYALYTKPRSEKKVYQALLEKEQESYLPTITRVRQWKDRKKKVDMPLFPSYLFVRIDYRFRFDILQINGVVKIVNFKGVPAVVPDWQINDLKKMLEHPDTLKLESTMPMGQMVEVTDGPFKGIRGWVKMIKDETRLVITIQSIQQSLSVEIDAGMLKKISEK